MAAFGYLPDTVEWDVMEEWGPLGADTLKGPSAIIAGYQELISEFPDWRVEPEEFIEVADVILVRAQISATGRSSGVRTEARFTQAWEFGADGTLDRVRSYTDHEAALAAYSR